MKIQIKMLKRLISILCAATMVASGAVVSVGAAPQSKKVELRDDLIENNKKREETQDRVKKNKKILEIKEQIKIFRNRLNELLKLVENGKTSASFENRKKGICDEILKIFKTAEKCYSTNDITLEELEQINLHIKKIIDGRVNELEREILEHWEREKKEKKGPKAKDNNAEKETKETKETNNRNYIETLKLEKQARKKVDKDIEQFRKDLAEWHKVVLKEFPDDKNINFRLRAINEDASRIFELARNSSPGITERLKSLVKKQSFSLREYVSNILFKHHRKLTTVSNLPPFDKHHRKLTTVSNLPPFDKRYDFFKEVADNEKISPGKMIKIFMRCIKEDRNLVRAEIEKYADMILKQKEVDFVNFTFRDLLFYDKVLREYILIRKLTCDRSQLQKNKELHHALSENIKVIEVLLPFLEKNPKYVKELSYCLGVNEDMVKDTLKNELILLKYDMGDCVNKNQYLLRNNVVNNIVLEKGESKEEQKNESGNNDENSKNGRNSDNIIINENDESNSIGVSDIENMNRDDDLLSSCEISEILFELDNRIIKYPTVDMFSEKNRLKNQILGNSDLGNSNSTNSKQSNEEESSEVSLSQNCIKSNSDSGRYFYSDNDTIHRVNIKIGSDSGSGSNLNSILINRSMKNLSYQKKLFQNKVLDNSDLGNSNSTNSKQSNEEESSEVVIHLDGIEGDLDSGSGSNNQSMNDLQYKKELFQNKVLDNSDLGNSQDNSRISMSRAIAYINYAESKNILDEGHAADLFNINTDCLDPIVAKILEDIYHGKEKEWSEEELEYINKVIATKKRVLNLQKNKTQIDDKEKLYFAEELKFLNNLEEYIKMINEERIKMINEERIKMIRGQRLKKIKEERQKDFEEEQDPSSEKLSDSSFLYEDLQQKELFGEIQLKDKSSKPKIPKLKIPEQAEQAKQAEQELREQREQEQYEQYEQEKANANAENIEDAVLKEIYQLEHQHKYGQAQIMLNKWNSFAKCVLKNK